MPIDIGINEGVYLSKVHLNDKATLELTFDEVDKVDKKAMNPFDMLNADTVVDQEVGKTIRIFPPSAPKEGNDRTEEANIEMLVADINGTKAILMHILKRYLTSDQIEGKFKPFDGLLIDASNFSTQIQKPEILRGAHTNLARSFMQLVAPFVNKPEFSSRLLLVRQSVDKNFPTFRKKYLDENPFYEDSIIKRTEDPTTNQSKVKFTQWEKDNKFDSAAVIEKDAKKGTTSSSGGTVASQPALTVGNVFGQ